MYARVGIDTYNDSKLELRDFLLKAKEGAKNTLKFINRNDVAFVSSWIAPVIFAIVWRMF